MVLIRYPCSDKFRVKNKDTVDIRDIVQIGFKRVVNIVEKSSAEPERQG